RAVAGIDFEECPDESAALAREAQLLRGLRPRFNRAGVWPSVPRFLAWRLSDDGMDLAVMPTTFPQSHVQPPKPVETISTSSHTLPRTPSTPSAPLGWNSSGPLAA